MISKHIRSAIALVAAAGMFAAVMAPTNSHAGVVDGVRTADGLMMYLGVVPAATVRGHAKSHPEARMHGGVPAGSQSMHIVAAVFDEASGARITDAKVRAHITEPGGLQRTIRLEPMTVAGALTFGGFTTFQRGIKYRIGIEVERPPHMQSSPSKNTPPRMPRVPAVTAHFTYTHD